MLSELSAAMESAPIEPDFLCVFYGCMHDDEAILAFVRDRFPDAAILGGTSCGGVMSEDGLGGERSIGLLLVEDPDGDYGTAAVRLQGNAADCAEQALHDALAAAGCAGELPELIWVYQAPGQEEAVLDGLRRVVGDRCPIVGGSAADEDVAGKWRQLGPTGLMSDGLVVGVLFSSGGIGFAFQSGYEPSGESGIVTQVDGGADECVTGASARGRRIVGIDGEPAAEVYNRWLGGALARKIASGGNIMIDTAMSPVGVEVGKIGGIPHYLLIHPNRILADGSLATFATIEEGARLFGMRGNRPNLVERAGKVAAAAASMLPGGPASLAGGLVIYCAGCMLAVGNEMPKVSRAVSASLDGAPFLGCFTFGEQGSILGRNAHGNLMISAIAFGK
ncbi:FIST signal transduction protein [Thauera sp. SDU_THAU2]|uniref:FIST signal transduction protein n=1 Tax=Thauera sp. SDU_THAU2 TaxID=3136633 RepID=UPI00311DE1E8